MALSKTQKTHLGLESVQGSVVIIQTRTLLLPPCFSMLTREAFYHLKRDSTPATGAAKAFRESQSRIFKTEAPQFVGAGEGTDNLDFMADLSVLKVIDPDTIPKEPPPEDEPVPNSPATILAQLMHNSIPCSHCAWCTETPKTRSMLEEHYFETHHVVLQPSCCAPPSVFQTIMGMELQLRQANFGSFSKGRVYLRENMKYDEAKDIIGAMCAVQEDKTKLWYVKMPHFEQLGDSSWLRPNCVF